MVLECEYDWTVLIRDQCDIVESVYAGQRVIVERVEILSDQCNIVGSVCIDL